MTFIQILILAVRYSTYYVLPDLKWPKSFYNEGRKNISKPPMESHSILIQIYFNLIFDGMSY